jgi:NADPH-dependent ferric siderophore reductase
VLTSTLVRPSYRPYRVEVAAIERVSSTFTRVTFTGPDLDVFGVDGLDQRIKLVLPLPGRGFSDFGIDDEETHLEGTWYTRWRELPDELRNPIRTYTVRRIDADSRRLDVDFALHGETGPASTWVSRAAVGDPLVIVGPDSRSPLSHEGIEFKPGTATRVLFAGDETAVPAICAILENLPPSISAHAILEVPHADDALTVVAHPGVSTRWIARNGARAGELLAPAVRDWYAAECGGVFASADDTVEPDTDEMLWETPVEDPHEGLYVWIAGESSMIKLIRRYLVRDCGIDRRQVAFMGYWREGSAEAS